MKSTPPARLLAEMCMVRAWDDDTDDESRKLLELASGTITTLCDRLEHQAANFERLEAAHDS
jgi:hypothetical protein